MNWEVEGLGLERDHKECCEHQTQCVTCETWFLKDRSRFPLGSQKMKICIVCFDDLWEDIIEDINIDWKRIEQEVNGNA